MGIPDELKVIVLTTLGEPDEVPKPKDRKDLHEMVSWGKFGNKAEWEMRVRILE